MRMDNISSVYGDCKKIAWTKKFKVGYILQREWIEHDRRSGIWMTVAYNHGGDYIGNSRDAYRLCFKKGIKPELAEPKHSVCSIGFCAKEKKWYGWSHRAIYGFGIGYMAKKGKLPTKSGFVDGYLEEHPEEDRRVPVGFKVKDLKDAKRVSIAFAESVS